MNMNYINRQAQRTELSLLLAQLNQQLISYQIVDYYGKIFATIKDFYYDSQKHINLLVNLITSKSESELRQINFELIQKVNLPQKQIVVNLSPEQFEQLPLYQPSLREQQSERTAMNHNKDEFERTIPLLEERLLVNRRQHKAGEIVVRKQIETRIIEVPLRREILIIEQVEPENKLLATIDLEEETINQSNFNHQGVKATEYLVRGEFESIEAANQILHKISQLPISDRQKIRIEIVADSPQQQAIYQQVMSNYQTT
ncbi:protein of unknown function DUF2382-containing protein [Stanieria cyanosphaera PCC 7437]|uniref:DUF2382 domain-containing protein n=1 Tax=Stanieria cyanosphaera (strain ATCC 29371 / PCC 7437) TaxID=111780 RepID=K9XUN1_STAC7|nr:DUF2382 domain-containing protein [Stanieria cyanosphaera]AFZ35769.1 protein of unknown function DUF2382-containing protein [Stanieria cyanosphaera PCC 7437]